MKERGLDEVFIDDAPPSIRILVNNFHKMQKKVANVCLQVVEEIDRLNRKSAKSKFTGIARLKETMTLIAQSTSQAYNYRPGISLYIYPYKKKTKKVQILEFSEHTTD